MYGDAERSVAPTGREWVSVDDGPGQTCSGAIAGAREQSADLFECEAESKRRGEDVGGCAVRHVVQTCIDGGYDERDQRCDSRYEWVVYGRDTQDPKRMAVQRLPVGGNKQEARANEGREEHEDAEIPDAIGIDADSFGNAKRQHQCEEEAESGHRAVRGDEQRADVEEDWMHLKQG